MSDDGGRGEGEVGRYDLVARLAIGGMGELFLARERGLAGFERLVAIKRILPNLASRSSFREMFLREARILARLNHPNIVQTFGLGEDEGNYYLVLEYLRGSTLRELQVLAEERGTRIEPDVALGIVVQALRGLHAAHELADLQGNSLGLVHRDVSPHNLMCTPDGNVKLFDFGVAKATEHRGERTFSGAIKGKFAYMSPEQCRREPLDRRSDLFSIGVVLWEIFAGRRLFKREAELDTMNAITSGDVPSLAAQNPELPGGLADAVHRALAVDRTERWSTAVEFEERLRSVADDAGLVIDARRVSAFVRSVGGERLAAREATLASALERSLTADEKLELVHATGSWTESLLEEPGEETIQVRPISLRDAPPQPPPSDEDELDALGPPPRRPWIRLAAGLVVLLFCAGLAALAYNPLPAGPPLTIAWAPTVEPNVLRAELEPVRAYLEEQLNRPVRLEITKSYQESADCLVGGGCDLAALPPYTYVKTRQREPKIEPLASKIFDGSKSSDGLILVPFDSPARRLQDLEGAKFCFSDENSTTGYILPRAFIRDAGYDVEEFVSAVHWSGDHLSVLQDLLAGRCQAGATYSGNLLTASSKGVATGKLRRLAITGSTPHETLTAGPGVDEPTREAIVRALLAFEPEDVTGEEYVGETQRITGFSPQYDEGYQQLRRGLGMQ